MTNLTIAAALANSRDITGWLEEAEAETLYHYAVELVAFFVLNDTSPVVIVTNLKANQEQVADGKE